MDEIKIDAKLIIPPDQIDETDLGSGSPVDIVDNGSSIEVHSSEGGIALIPEDMIAVVRNFKYSEARVTEIQPRINKIQVVLKK